MLIDWVSFVDPLVYGGGGEMVTLVAGQDGTELAGRTAAYLRRTRPTVDVVVYDGGQDRYPLLIGVE